MGDRSQHSEHSFLKNKDQFVFQAYCMQSMSLSCTDKVAAKRKWTDLTLADKVMAVDEIGEKKTL